MAISGVAHGVIRFTTNGTLTGRRQVTYLRWIGATTAGHTLTLSDSNGARWFESEADGANFIDIHPVFNEINGLVVTLTSGTFYVYTR